MAVFIQKSDSVIWGIIDIILVIALIYFAIWALNRYVPITFRTQSA